MIEIILFNFIQSKFNKFQINHLLSPTNMAGPVHLLNEWDTNWKMLRNYGTIIVFIILHWQEIV